MTAKKGPIVLKQCTDCKKMVKRTYNHVCNDCHNDRLAPSQEYITRMKAIIRAEREAIGPAKSGDDLAEHNRTRFPKVYKTPRVK